MLKDEDKAHCNHYDAVGFEGYQAADTDEGEEHKETPVVGQITGKHARYHHTQSLEGGTDTEDGGTLLALGKVNQEQGIGRKAKAVAQLFQRHT